MSKPNEDDFMDGFTDGVEAAIHYDFMVHRISDILHASRKSRILYRRAIMTLGEDLIIEMLGHALVFSDTGKERNHFDDHLEEMLEEYTEL